MSDIADIRKAILLKLKGIAAIGAVNDFERFSKSQSDMARMYMYEQSAGSTQFLILGWNIRRTSTREVFIDTGRWECLARWRLTGYMALNDQDESEKLFDDKIEAIRDAFRSDQDLGGAVLSTIDPSTNEAGIQVLESGPVLFAGALCHKAALGLTTQYLK